MTTCSCERSSEPSLTQALHLANGDTINQKLRDDKGVVARLVASRARPTTGAGHALPGRPEPAADPVRAGAALARSLADATAGMKDAKEAKASAAAGDRGLYWAVLTGKEFLFNH